MRTAMQYKSMLSQPQPAATEAGRSRQPGSMAFQDNRNDHTPAQRTMIQASTSAGTWPGRYAPGTALQQGPVTAGGPVVQGLWTAAYFWRLLNQRYKPSRSYGQTFKDMFFQSKMQEENPEFSRIWSMLSLYHEVEEDNDDNESTRHEKLELLHKIDQTIYAWYAGHKSKETPGGLQRSPYTVVLTSLMEDVQAERRQVIGQVVSNKEKIWVPGIEDMEPAHRKKLQMLWTSLTTNSGNLKTEGNDELKLQMHAMYAQLLGGHEGRRLLRSINSNKNQVTIKGKNGGQPQLDPRSSVKSHLRPRGNQKAVNKFFNNPQASVTYSRDIASGLSHGKGTSSTVEWLTSSRERQYAVQGSNWKGHHGDYELLPTFVTLGHELAHAERNQQGRSKLFIKYPEHNTPGGRDWHNAEEEDVITGVENKIRKEQGLGLRKYHKASPGYGNSGVL